MDTNPKNPDIHFDDEPEDPRKDERREGYTAEEASLMGFHGDEHQEAAEDELEGN